MTNLNITSAQNCGFSLIYYGKELKITKTYLKTYNYFSPITVYNILQKKSTQVVTKVDTVYRIHILTTQSAEQSDSITNNIKEVLYEDSLFVNIQSIKKDSTFNIIIAKCWANIFPITQMS